MNKKMIICVALLCSFAVAQVSVGLSTAFQTNIYRNSDDKNILPLPFISYENQHFFINGSEFGAFIYKDDVFAISPSFSLRFDGYKNPKGYMYGMDDRKMTLDAGIKAEVKTPYGSLKAELYHDALNRYEGANAQLEYSYLFRINKLGISPFIGAEYLSENLVDYYYGVKKNEQTINRPYYKGKSSIVYKTGINVYYSVNEFWSFLGGVHGSFFENEIKNSPIIKDDFKTRGYVGVSFRF